MSFRSSLTPVLVLALALGGCDRGGTDEAQETKTAATPSSEPFIDTAMAGDLMPASLLTDTDGEELNTGALVGEPVLVNLWATWCAPCVKEMPLIDQLAADYEGRLRVVTVNEDLGDGEKVRKFFAEKNFRHLPQWMDSDGTFMMKLFAQSLPVTVLYDAQGKEVWRVVGDFDWSGEEARAAIDAALET